MTARRHIALLGTTFGLMLGSLPAQATLTTHHGVYAETQHCCWDVRFNIVSISGSAPSYSVASWSAQANISGNVGYGQISGAAEVSSSVVGYVYANGVAEARDYWVDSFDVTSALLAPGTPVTLRLGVALDADVNTTNFGKGSALAVIGTGLDAGWLAGVDTNVVGDGGHVATYDYLTYVGAHLSFVGQLKTRAWAEGNNGSGVGTASSNRRRALHHRKHDRGRRLPKRQRCQLRRTQLARTGASHLGADARRRRCARRVAPASRPRLRQPVSPSRLLCPTASAYSSPQVCGGWRCQRLSGGSNFKSVCSVA